MVYNVLVFAEKETTELQFKTHAELQIKRLKKKNSSWQADRTD